MSGGECASERKEAGEGGIVGMEQTMGKFYAMNDLTNEVVDI